MVNPEREISEPTPDSPETPDTPDLNPDTFTIKHPIQPRDFPVRKIDWSNGEPTLGDCETD